MTTQGNSQQKRKPQRFVFFGNFGQKNLGNEATLWAIVFNLRKSIPDAVIGCVCTGPEEISSTFHINAVPIHGTFIRPDFLQRNVLTKLLRKLFVGIPVEIYRWVQAIKVLAEADAFIVPGTQFLSDNLTGPWAWPYMAFKWSVAAKVTRCKILFVSVGIGPLDRPLSRLLVNAALRLADFRSYRDDLSRECACSIGVDAGKDPIYPDLAFSLPVPAVLSGQSKPGEKPIVAVGIKDFHAQYRPSKERLSGSEAYQRYIDRMASFVAWLLERGYKVRPVIGDVLYDRHVLTDLQEALKTRCLGHYADGFADCPIASFEDLIAQLSAIDIVVSPRFHNIVFALLLNRPVLALSYHDKFSALLESPDLAKFNIAIEDADPATLVERFCQLERARDHLSRQINENVRRYRTALDEQYGRILECVGA